MNCLLAQEDRFLSHPYKKAASTGYKPNNRSKYGYGNIADESWGFGAADTSPEMDYAGDSAGDIMIERE